MTALGRQQPEVFVRFVRTEAFDDPLLRVRARAILSTDERSSLDRLRPAQARRDYLAAHALVRTALASFAGCEPEQVRLAAGPHPRPSVVAPATACRLRISIAHADGVAICAIATGRAVGADVESRRNVGGDPLPMAQAVCSEREMHVLAKLTAGARKETFLRVWTAKESVLKATGLARRLHPSLITVHAGQDVPPSVEFAPGVDEDGHGWHVATWQLPPWHTLAIAVRAAPGEAVRVWFAEDRRLLGGKDVSDPCVRQMPR
jgi:4'-phosphopantetheinyl transferase